MAWESGKEESEMADFGEQFAAHKVEKCFETENGEAGEANPCHFSFFCVVKVMQSKVGLGGGSWGSFRHGSNKCSEKDNSLLQL